MDLEVTLCGQQEWTFKLNVRVNVDKKLYNFRENPSVREHFVNPRTPELQIFNIVFID